MLLYRTLLPLLLRVLQRALAKLRYLLWEHLRCLLMLVLLMLRIRLHQQLGLCSHSQDTVCFVLDDYSAPSCYLPIGIQCDYASIVGNHDWAIRISLPLGRIELWPRMVSHSGSNPTIATDCVLPDVPGLKANIRWRRSRTAQVSHLPALPNDGVFLQGLIIFTCSPVLLRLLLFYNYIVVGMQRPSITQLPPRRVTLADLRNIR